MNLPAHCIRRPVMTTLLTAALCVFGAMAYRFLPVNDLPNIDFPTIVVTANLPPKSVVRGCQKYDTGKKSFSTTRDVFTKEKTERDK